MRISKKVKIAMLAGISAITLASCSNTQMAVTGLSLAAAAVGYEAYHWMNDPDASTAVANPPAQVFKAVQDVMKSNPQYEVTSVTTGEKHSDIKAIANGKEVMVVVENIGNNESKIYIKDGRGKDQATILLNQIMKDIK